MNWDRMVIRGVGVVNAMPTDSNGELVEDEYRRHLNFLKNSGVGFVQPGAATGQVFQTTEDEFRRTLDICVEELKGDVAVTAYSGRASTVETVRLTKYAKDAGADAAFITPPVFTKPDSRGLEDHYSEVLESVDLPVVLYNNPDRTGVAFDLDMVRKLILKYPAVIGYKDADGGTFGAAWRALGDLIPVWPRSEQESLFTLAMGGPGFLSFSGNLIAPQLVHMHSLWSEGRYGDARAEYYKYAPVMAACHLGPIPSCIKYMLNATGWNFGNPRKPVLPVNDEIAQRLDALTPLIKDTSSS